MTATTRRKLTLGSAAAMLAAAMLMIATGWAITNYIDLIELEVELTDACARIDAESRSRVALAANLLQNAPTLSRIDRDGLDEIARLVDGARDLRLVPSRLADGDQLVRYGKAQEDLTTALGLFLRDADLRARPATRTMLFEIRSKLDRSTRHIEQSMVSLEHCINAYHEAAETFPNSVLVGTARFQRRSDRADP